MRIAFLPERLKPLKRFPVAEARERFNSFIAEEMRHARPWVLGYFVCVALVYPIGSRLLRLIPIDQNGFALLVSEGAITISGIVLTSVLFLNFVLPSKLQKFLEKRSGAL